MARYFKNRYYWFVSLLFLFVITIAFLNTVNANNGKLSQSNFVIKQVISNELLETKSGIFVQIPHISAPDKYWHAERFDVCYHRKTKEFLQLNIVGKILIVHGAYESDKGIHLPDKIILPSGENLSEVMIALGLAQNISNDTSLINLEDQSKDKFSGIWQRCNQENKIQIQNRLERKINLSESIKPHFQEQSNGKIRSIISNNIVELKNGLQVTIWGLKSMDHQKSITPAHQCFREKSIRYLEKKLRHKMVFMEKPKKTQDTRKKIKRRISLDEPLSSRLESVLESAIKSGYGLPDLSAANNEDQKSQWQTWSDKAIKEKIGAWGDCQDKIVQTFFKQLNTETVTHEAKKIDSNCPIKGNITGTKSQPIKKYHTIASPWYERTQAEACFETEEKAVMAGFVKVK
jgi:hypothetical protein